MRIYVIIICLIVSINHIFSQKSNYSNDWLKQLDYPKSDIYILNKDNYINKYKKYDFSSLIIPSTDFIGFIGSDYKRFKIYYTSIFKDKEIDTIYHVKGFLNIDNDKHNFIGTIAIIQIREYKSLHLGVDELYKDSNIISQGLFIATYDLREDINHKNSGLLNGLMGLNWYLDYNSKLTYDRIRIYSDDYKNNQYIGIRKSNSDNRVLICNWGEYRISYSGDLDIGASEFSPNPKYYSNGWSDLIIK
jgi:hypothetical protein